MTGSSFKGAELYYVYIMASRYRGTLYVGVTNNIARRVWEHKHGIVEGFTKKYGVTTLVYMEPHESIKVALQREKLVKKWKRSIKFEAIERDNPEWQDLYIRLNF